MRPVRAQTVGCDDGAGRGLGRRRAGSFALPVLGVLHFVFSKAFHRWKRSSVSLSEVPSTLPRKVPSRSRPPCHSPPGTRSDQSHQQSPRLRPCPADSPSFSQRRWNLPDVPLAAQTSSCHPRWSHQYCMIRTDPRSLDSGKSLRCLH